MRSSNEWWNEVKSNPVKLADWLQRQYIGEVAAVNLLSEVLMKYGHSATNPQWMDIMKVLQQEALHGKWIKTLMDKRGIEPAPNAEATARYWKEVLPNVTSFKEAMAAAFHAENMRLARIRAIANDDSLKGTDLEDIQDTFKHILPHEEWHEEVFGKMRAGTNMTRYHEKGLEALNLTLE